VLRQDALRYVSTQADLAVGDDDLPVFGQFTQACAQFREGDGHGPGDDAARRLFRLADIQQHRSTGQLVLQLLGRNGLCDLREVVLGDEAQHVDGVLCAAIGRCIRQFQVCEVVHGCTHPDAVARTSMRLSTPS